MKQNVLKIVVMAVMLTLPVFQASTGKEPVTAVAAQGTSAKQSVKKYYVTSDVLNVRSGPGTDHPAIGSLTHGMEVKVIAIKGEKGNRWAKIRFEGLTAYVSARNLAKAGEDTGTSAQEGTSAKQSVKKYYVTSDALNVRSGPGTDYPVLGSLTRGMEVKVTSIKGEKGNRWAEIKFEGLTAYASVTHLAKK